MPFSPRVPRVTGVVCRPPRVHGPSETDELIDQILAAAGGEANLFGLWLYGQGMTVSGGVVSAWQAVRGAGTRPTLTQATVGSRPTDNGVAVLCDGTDDFMSTGALTLNQPEHVIAVMNQVTWTSIDALWDGVTATAMLLDQNTATPQIRAFSTSGFNSSALAVNTYAVVSVLYNNTSSEIRVNGGTAATGGSAAPSNAGGFVIGARGDGTSPGNVGYKAIVLGTVAFSTAQRQAVERLLGATYGITVA